MPHTRLMTMEIRPVATFHSPFASKFGIPRQAGVVPTLRGEIVFERAYRNPDALRGIDGFDFLWLIWGFSANSHAPTSLMVRPPRLGGNERVGVFASRSPFRPNGLGLSAVRLERVEWSTSRGPILHVLGADLMDGTPIFDIKPYMPYADSHGEARSGFAGQHDWHRLKVALTPTTQQALSGLGLDAADVSQLCDVIAEDPRPQYQKTPSKVYGFTFKGVEVRFRVEGGEAKFVF